MPLKTAVNKLLLVMIFLLGVFSSAANEKGINDTVDFVFPENLTPGPVTVFTFANGRVLISRSNVTIQRDGNRVLMTGIASFDPSGPQDPRRQTMIPLGTFGPGDYVLDVEVIAPLSGVTIVASIPFTVSALAVPTLNLFGLGLLAVALAFLGHWHLKALCSTENRKCDGV